MDAILSSPRTPTFTPLLDTPWMQVAEQGIIVLSQISPFPYLLTGGYILQLPSPGKSARDAPDSDSFSSQEWQCPAAMNLPGHHLLPWPIETLQSKTFTRRLERGLRSCSSKGPGFNSQHLHSSSQLSDSNSRASDTLKQTYKTYIKHWGTWNKHLKKAFYEALFCILLPK